MLNLRTVKELVAVRIIECFDTIQKRIKDTRDNMLRHDLLFWFCLNCHLNTDISKILLNTPGQLRSVGIVDKQQFKAESGSVLLSYRITIRYLPAGFLEQFACLAAS